MAKKLDQRLLDILLKYGEKPETALWDCHGVWVAYHAAVERIAARADIKYDTPQVLVAEREAAAILVTGRMGERSEWSIGEAAINLNYKVKGNQPGYPFAMAEKRAKDRVVLKLIGLHGAIYSEEEMDDVRPDAPAPKPEKGWRADGTKTSYALKNEGSWQTVKTELDNEFLDIKTMSSLRELWNVYRKKAIELHWNREFMAALGGEFDAKEAELQKQIDAATSTEDAILDQFEGSKVVSNSYTSAYSAG